MDPYKLIGFDEHLIKTKDDLERIRVRVKKKWKQLVVAGDKFEAANLNKAWETVQHRYHHPPEQLYGRSRKERELEGFYQHQGKELRQNKHTIDKIREKESKYHAFNKQVPRSERAEQYKKAQKRLAYERYKREKKKKMAALAAAGASTVQNKQSDPIVMLTRVMQHIEIEHKFAKAIPMLRRWIHELMDWNNRGHIFAAMMRLIGRFYRLSRYF